MRCSPVIHERLGLECPCFTRNPTYGTVVAPTEKPVTATLHQNLTPRDKELLKPKVIEIPFEEDAFTQDWKDWKRHIWNISNFYGSFPLIIEGEKISGFSLDSGFVNRIPRLVTENQGLVVSGSKQSKLVFSFQNEPHAIQFSVLALKDRMSIIVDGNPIKPSEYIMGKQVKIAGRDFVGNPKIMDHEGMSDILFKFASVKKVEVIFNNRLVLTDVLYK